MWSPEKHINCLILVPVYNEEELQLKKLVELLSNTGLRIVIIDDGSKTPVRNFLQYPQVTHLRHASNLGQGAALQTGFDFASRAGADYVISFDGDGQHDVADIPAMLQPLLNNEADITLGSRFLPGSWHNAPPRRTVLLKISRFINNILTGITLTDAHNGLRGLNRKAFQSIRLNENRMAHATELISAIKKLKLRYREVPVKISYSEYSRKKGQSGWDGFKILLDLALHRLFK